MKKQEQLAMAHDILQTVLRGDDPFKGWLDQDDVVIANALGGWLIGAIDAMWWALGEEEASQTDPDREEDSDEKKAKIPPGLGGFLETVIRVAGEQGYELTPVEPEGTTEARRTPENPGRARGNHRGP